MQADGGGAGGHAATSVAAGRAASGTARAARAGDESGIAAEVALHADQLLHLVVVRRDVGVARTASRPCRHPAPARGRKAAGSRCPRTAASSRPSAPSRRRRAGAARRRAGVLDGLRRVGRQVRGNRWVGPGEVAHVHLEVVVGEHVPIGPAPSRLVKWLGPFSKTMTSHPALRAPWRRTSRRAAADHDRLAHVTPYNAQEPQRLGHDARVGHRIAAVRALDLARGVAARLDVAG